MEFENKVIIVTGGTGGIGSAVAEALAQEGARVIIVGRSKKKIETALKFFQGKNIRIFSEECDVSREGDVRRLVRRVIASFRKIDILVNCAGVQSPIGPFIGNSFSDWEKNIRVNLLGTVLMCKAVIPYMIKRKSGSVVNFAGGGAASARPNFSAYATAKAAVVRFTEVLADEVKKCGIRMNAIAPGAVNTAMTHEVLKAGRKAGEKELADVKKRLKNGGTSPELAADLVLFLASDRSKGLSGKLISAVWDNWRQWGRKDIEKIMKSDRYTLRRIQ